MTPEKRLALTNAVDVASGSPVSGYEIHIGRTDGHDVSRAWLRIDGRPEGAMSPDGLVRGCYLHGLFASDGFRAAWLAEMGAQSTIADYGSTVDDALDQLARHLETHMDLDRLFRLADEV